jgi:hypothetical protein
VKEEGGITALRVRGGQLFAGVLVSYDKPTEWHRITDSGLAKEFVTEKTVVDPTINQYEADKGFDVHEGPLAGKRLQAEWAGKGRQEGLWALKNGKGDLIAKGNFSRPVLCPGGEWIVVAKTFGNNSWAEPNGVVRIHLPDKHAYPVDLPPADTFDAIVWIDARKRVLLYQQRDWRDGKAGPEEPEFYLLDPVTGAHQKVTGEMRAFFDAGKYDLQPTRNPNEFWAARHSSVVEPQLRTTTVGRFDSHDFRFTPLVTCPDMQFESDAVFVDEPAGTIWIAVNGDLLRLSLPSNSPPSN